MEAGCGEGNVTKHVSDWLKKRHASCEFTAFDISEKLIRENSSCHPDVTYFSHDIYNPIPSDYFPPSGKFTLIVCSEVLEHLDHPDQAVKNLLDCGNEFIFSVPHEPIWRLLNMVRGKYMKQLGNTPGHIQHFSSKSFCTMLEMSGLTVVKMKKPLPWLMVYCKKI